MACGTGLLTVPIAAAGLPTVGFDLSGPMLDAARQRAITAGVSIDFVQGNMREFNIGRQFDFIFVARNSLQHLLSTEDLLSSFAAVRRHLSPRGLFMFDVCNPDVRILSRHPDRRFPVMELTTAVFGALRVESAHQYDAATQISHGTWYISTKDQPDGWIVPVTVRCIFPQELPLLIAESGFELVRRFGDVSRAPFASESPRQICICRPLSTCTR